MTYLRFWVFLFAYRPPWYFYLVWWRKRNTLCKTEYGGANYFFRHASIKNGIKAFNAIQMDAVIGSLPICY